MTGKKASSAKDTNRTLIAVLASQKSRQKNEELAQALALFHNELCVGRERKPGNAFHFILTGGTFDRLVRIHDPQLNKGKKPSGDSARIREKLGRSWDWPELRVKANPKPWVRWDPYDAGRLLDRTGVPQQRTLTLTRHEKNVFFDFLRNNSTILPRFRDGGVTLLAHLVVRRACSITWLFLSPNDMHWLNPDNLALMRLCDHFRAKRLMSLGSVVGWIKEESRADRMRNPREVLDASIAEVTFAPPRQDEERSAIPREPHPCGQYKEIRLQGTSPSKRRKRSGVAQTLALIAHDDMKKQMASFALDYEPELHRCFERILATGTTGKLIQDTAPSLRSSVIPLHSGPKGGDIEIAVEILAGRCHYVVFFIDPLRPHPHIDDVRVVIGACMRTSGVEIFTNEAQARSWMENVVRPKW